MDRRGVGWAGMAYLMARGVQERDLPALRLKHHGSGRDGDACEAARRTAARTVLAPCEGRRQVGAEAKQCA